ncbi:MAG: YopX family protein [Firmicutes bacterium]|nr:YopX family protein [Bacillota bacterium]
MNRFMFRIWDKEAQKMIYLRLKDIVDADEWWYDMSDDWNSWLVLDDATGQQKRFALMQCTGLRDKNGKLIYESDILEAYNNNEFVILMENYPEPSRNEIGIVKMSGLGCWSIYIDYLNLIIPIAEFIDYQLSIVHDFSRIENLGNIYENLDLLRKDDENVV